MTIKLAEQEQKYLPLSEMPTGHGWYIETGSLTHNLWVRVVERKLDDMPADELNRALAAIGRALIKKIQRQEREIEKIKNRS